jgi:hypothetical protein
LEIEAALFRGEVVAPPGLCSYCMCGVVAAVIHAPVLACHCLAMRVELILEHVLKCNAARGLESE